MPLIAYGNGLDTNGFSMDSQPTLLMVPCLRVRPCMCGTTRATCWSAIPSAPQTLLPSTIPAIADVK